MVFHPLSKLFEKKHAIVWDEIDVRHFVQTWLRHQIKTDQLYCERVRGQTAYVRVLSPAARQAALLLIPDLQAALQQEAHYVLDKVLVR